ncbi:MAG TPA: N-acetylmuramoyl-L-alanine amidase [Candidatus Binatia bacterium]|jgi:N-acetylmuramoyl-L-alanine amidase
MQVRRIVLLVALLLSFASHAAPAPVLQDRQLYLSAKNEYDQVAKIKLTPQARTRFERVAERFERLPQEFPKSRYCDAAYYYAATLHQELYESSREQRSLDRAIRNFRLLVGKYPNGAYAAEGRYRLAMALDAGKGDRREARQQYAIVAAKYSRSDWGRRARERVAALDAAAEQERKHRPQPTVAATTKPVQEPELPKAVSLIEKPPASAQPAKPAPQVLRKIVLDPGHGGKDPGAVGADGIAEKDIVLGIAQKLSEKLKSLGIEVVLTRKDDRFIPLEERTAIANAEAADLFISLHVNASPNPDARGVETYYLDNTNDEAALRMAARENGIARDKISDLQFILSDMVQNLKLEDSITLAHRLQGSVVTQVGGRYGEVRDLGVKKAQFYVLVGARMPSVLVEMFFVSNRIEGRALATDEYQQSLAEALFDGIKKYQETAQVVKNL